MELALISPKHGSKTVLIDDESYQLIKDWNLNLVKESNSFYVVCYKNGVSAKLHRIIMGVSDPKIFIDHIDGNGLNNIKSNLRVATLAENSRNAGVTKRSTTGYKGVYRYKDGNKNAGRYTAALKINGKSILGGYFSSAEDAAKKYNELALKYHGEFANLNEINGNRGNEIYIKPIKKVISQSDCKYGYRGVTKAKDGRKRPYRAQYSEKGGNSAYIGNYFTLQEAARAYNEFILNNGKDIRLLNTIPNE